MASDSERLSAFIRAAKDRGADDAFVVAMLRENGWSERRIYAAFSSYYEEVLGQPVPSRGAGIEYARDAFMYLIAFIALGSWTVAVGSLFYALIDRWFPSPLDSSYLFTSLRGQVAGQLATIIVAFPIFMLVSRALSREVQRRPEAADSGVRKWLTYLALVIAAVVLIGDAVLFIASFLQGDLNVRFVLKSAVLVAIAGAVFLYYLATVRADAVSAARDRAFALAAGAAVVAALVFGFFDIGTPAHARAVAMDLRRVDNLTTIANRIHTDSGDNKPARAPRSLADVSLGNVPLDPATKKPYEYRLLGGASYELCATFDTDDKTEVPNVTAADNSFLHPAGPFCFKLDAGKTY